MTRLLVVEDNLNYRQTLIKILEREGYIVVGVPDGTAALRKVRGQDYALAIVDLRLPDMSGIEVLKAINGISPHTESLMLTAFPCDESIGQAKELGTYAYVKKTNDVDHTMMLVRKAVELYEARQELRKLKKLTQELGEEPKANPDGQEFKLKIIEWRGYVTRALEDIDKRLEGLDKDVGNLVSMIRKGDDKVNGLQVKMAAMAGTVGVLSALITSFILSKIGG